jgi:uncharacterized protein YgbK (DUF1537 family)
MGCIANDFTGGTDLASMLVKCGNFGRSDFFLKPWAYFPCCFDTGHS